MCRLLFALLAGVLMLPVPLAAQTITGTCTEFVDYLNAHGVAANSTEHPGKSTWTTAAFTVNIQQQAVAFSDTEGKMLCYKGSAVFGIIATPVVARLDWSSTDEACDNCACKAEHDKYEDALNKRVEKIKTQGLALANDAALKWGLYEDRVCVRATIKNPDAAAAAEFTKKANKAAAKTSELLRKVFRKSLSNYESTPAGQIAPPNCAACTPCGPGQTASCSVCDAPNVLYGAMCLTPCGQYTPPIWANCGLTQMASPVQCCERPGTPRGVWVCSPFPNGGCDWPPP